MGTIVVIVVVVLVFLLLGLTTEFVTGGWRRIPRYMGFGVVGVLLLVAVLFVGVMIGSSGTDNTPPGPFSILNDGGTDNLTALNTGPALPASAFQSVQGFDAFNPGTNFHDITDPLNHNGIVFFPGSSALYKDVDGSGRKVLVGGLGVSGDGVDQDDVVTFTASLGFRPEAPTPRADQVFVRGIRLPYQKFNRQPNV